MLGVSRTTAPAEAMDIALIPPGRPREGGSMPLLQQSEHDAIGWERLPVASHESIVGRHKSDSVELDPRPPTSHVARTDQETFGKIFPRNIAYGTLTRHGTIFVGFRSDQLILRAMLESMVGATDRPPDELITVTTPHRELLRDPVRRPARGARR